MEQVENMCTADTIPFDSDDLGQMEEFVTELRRLLRKSKAKVRLLMCYNDLQRDPGNYFSRYITFRVIISDCAVYGTYCRISRETRRFAALWRRA